MSINLERNPPRWMKCGFCRWGPADWCKNLDWKNCKEFERREWRMKCPNCDSERVVYCPQIPFRNDQYHCRDCKTEWVTCGGKTHILDSNRKRQEEIKERMKSE